MFPVNEPLLDGNEKKYVTECIDTGWISSEGPFVDRFENDFSSYLGVEHGVAVSSGTAAIETALYAAGVSEGDEVILPTFTIISCAVAVLRLGAKPVLVDICPDTWCMDVSQVEKKITNKTKVIMPVHIYGHPVEMTPLLELAERHDLIILEDAAEAHGAEYRGQKCGSIGQIACFSFYPNKLVTTGEGGMVVTSNSEFAERARSYRNLCFEQSARFLHRNLGYNFRMTNVQAAIGVAQVERLDEIVEYKRALGSYYVSKLKEIPGVQVQVERDWAKTVYWMYCVQLDSSYEVSAADVMAVLRKEKVGTRPFFRGMHDQPVFESMNMFKGERYPVCDRASEYGFYLPSGMTMNEEKVDAVVAIFKSALEKLRGGVAI